MATLVVILPDVPADPPLWGLFEDGVCTRSGRVRPVFDAMPEKVVAVVPGTAVLMRRVTFPPQSEKAMRKAAPFLLEDDLAVDAVEMHFAIGSGGEERPLAAVAHNAMRGWIAQLAEMALVATTLLPEFCAVTAADGEATVVDLGSRVILRHNDQGCSAEPGLLSHIAEEYLGGARAVRLHTADPTHLTAGALKPFASLIRTAPLSDALRLESALLAAADGINLLQGIYASRRDWQGIRKDWRRAARLSGLAGAAALALFVVEGARLQRQAEQATARAEAVFRQALPDVKRVVNPRAQIRAELQSLKAKVSSSFLQSSDLLFGVVAETDGSEIQTLRFDAKRGETTATLLLPSFDAIEHIKTAVKQKGGVLQEGGARQEGERILADITVRLP